MVEAGISGMRVPSEELHLLVQFASKALDLGAAGNVSAGYGYLLSGLYRALKFRGAKEPWSRELVKQYHGVLLQYAQRFRMGTEQPITEILHKETCDLLHLVPGHTLAGADLRGLDLDQANLERQDLSRVNLRAASLQDALLEAAILTGADCTRTAG